MKNTVSAAGGAMLSAILTRQNLVDETTGEVNLAVLKGMARREALATWGTISPRSLRAALRQYAGMIPQLQSAWRERHGLPVAVTIVTPYGEQGLHALRSTF